MAVHWLDLVRFADTIGYHSDNFMEVSAYREYVIDAFNENLPYDRFVIENIAGDLFPEGTEGGKTNALSSIWEDRAGFEEALRESSEKAEQLLGVIQDSGDTKEIGIALGALGKSCGKCHKPYRKKM